LLGEFVLGAGQMTEPNAEEAVTTSDKQHEQPISDLAKRAAAAKLVGIEFKLNPDVVAYLHCLPLLFLLLFYTSKYINPTYWFRIGEFGHNMPERAD
jgi:hypothetical protein